MVTNRARQEIVWIAPNEKIPKVAQTPGTVDVFDLRSGISGPTSRGSFRLSKSSWMMDPTRSRDAQLLSCCFSRNPAGGLPTLAREFDQ